MRRSTLAAAVVMAFACAPAAGDRPLQWDTDPMVCGPAGGSGTWSAGGKTWWDGSAKVAFAAGADVIFGEPAGTVTLGDDLTAGAVRFNAPGYTLLTNGKVLTVTKGLSGEGLTIRHSGRAGGLRFEGDAALDATLRGPGSPTVAVAGCTVTFNGTWRGAENGGMKSHVRLSRKGRFVFGPRAVVNNNLPDLVNARVFYLTGEGTGEVVEFAPGFQADRMGFPDAWTNNGLSVIICQDVTLVTHETPGLPTVHKKGSSGCLSHHGLVVFGPGGSAWVARTAGQVYDGGIWCGGDVTLEVHTSLTHSGVYSDHARVYFGSGREGPITLVKTGPGVLNLAGTQANGKGSAMRIDAGAVNFHTDPGDPGELYRAQNGPTSAGQHLALSVRKGAAANLLAPAAHLRSLASAGTVTLRGGPLDVSEDLALSAGSELRLSLRRGARVTVGGTFTQAGTLAIDDLGRLAAGKHGIVEAGAFKGKLVVRLPAGCEGTYNDGVLQITSAPAATEGRRR